MVTRRIDWGLLNRAAAITFPWQHRQLHQHQDQCRNSMLFRVRKLEFVQVMRFIRLSVNDVIKVSKQ